MTTHTASRAPRVAPIDLPAAARTATSRKGIVNLLRALGLDAPPRLQTDRQLTARLRSYDVAEAIRAAELGTLDVILTEMTAAPDSSALVRLARAVRRCAPTRLLLLVLVGPSYRAITLACFASDNELRHLTFDPTAVLASDIDILRDMTVPSGETGVAAALRFASALDSRVVSARFFTDIRMHRDAISAAWTGISPGLTAERDQLSLLLLCRLLFLYFLQRQGHLAGNENFMRVLVREWQRRSVHNSSLYADVLSPLFFGSLNTRPEKRSSSAAGLGQLPYLNGGLFERHSIERRHPDLDLPNSVAVALFDGVLERFRFTAVDAAVRQHSGVRDTQIDPEMLGRVFENLMSADRRSNTGTYYTPPEMVARLTTRVLAEHLQNGTDESMASIGSLITTGDASGISYRNRRRIVQALQKTRVLDPACGSGAFLLGALSALAVARSGLGEQPVAVRRDVVSRCLHGVDIQEDAALLCSLRLWLALADTSDAAPPPLPNLDRRIRQGDSLIDPLELLQAGAGSDIDARARRDGAVRNALSALAPLSSSYMDAEPELRLALRAELACAETRVAEAWLSAVSLRLRHSLGDARARSQSRDLWNVLTPAAAAAQVEVRRLEKRSNEVLRLLAELDGADALPFFSFRLHFAERPNFDVILCNPPWVRAHRWPAVVGAAIRERYAVCRSGGQVDLSLLFLERSLGLLAPGGSLGMLLPAKTLRSLYAAGARALLLRDATILSLEDHSLDHRSVFRADAFTVAVTARTHSSTERDASPRAVQIRMIRKGVPPLEFEQTTSELSLARGDGSAPWLLAPPDVLRAFRTMQAAGPSISDMDGLFVKRGVVTGANDVLVVREFTNKLGGLSHIRAEGYFRARKLSHSTAAARRFVGYVESFALHPLIRGSDIRAWCCEPSARVIWVPPDRRPTIPAPYLERYLLRHEAALAARTGISSAASPGSLMRVSSATLGHKVVWQDIADTLHAVAVPAGAGDAQPIIPLNSVYYLAVPDEDTAVLLAAYLNSLPLRVFARAAAERAKDARFRFFAWTIGMLPLPALWRTAYAQDLLVLSRKAHDDGGLSCVLQLRLDAMVARSFGLMDEDVSALLAFDQWLRGEPQ